MMIIVIMQVLKQQNFKLEASNANLSMMSSTMSPLQVMMMMMMTMMMMTMMMMMMMMMMMISRGRSKLT